MRGQHAKLLSTEDFENLINKPYEAFINDLMSFEIGEILRFIPSSKSHEIERFLTRRLLDQYSFILNNIPVIFRKFIEAYTTKFEVINLQRITRYLFSKADVDLKEAINLRPQEMLGRTAFIAKLLQCKDLGEFLDELTKTEYKNEIEVAEKIYSTVGDIWPLEFAFETFYIKKMLQEANKLKYNNKKDALRFVYSELLIILILVILKADFVEVDIKEALQLIPIPKDFPYKRQISKMISDNVLKTDLEVLKSLKSTKIDDGIKKYEDDKMFLHMEIAVRAFQLNYHRKLFYKDFGILSILSYLKQYETQIQDLNKLLYLKEYKFPVEKTKELIVDLI